MANRTPSEDEINSIESSLPREAALFSPYMYFYQNFWCPALFLPSLASLPSRFHPRPTDIILASKPKSGTTWLKALAFSILNRHIYPTNSQHHPLLSNNPHQLVPFLEANLNSDPTTTPTRSDHRPRVFGTHLPYGALPDSIKNSGCRIVYISRNVLDTAVSFWTFAQRSKVREGGPESLEDYLDSICRGVEEFGPYWDHVLGYWEESLARPSKVLFIKYEAMKADEAGAELKKLAGFVGCGFSEEEEECGVIDEISKLCSFRRLKELEVNKSGRCNVFVNNSDFFRKGEVGDWVNHVSPAMADRVHKVMQLKFIGSGYTF